MPRNSIPKQYVEHYLPKVERRHFEDVFAKYSIFNREQESKLTKAGYGTEPQITTYTFDYEQNDETHPKQSQEPRQARKSGDPLLNAFTELNVRSN